MPVFYDEWLDTGSALGWIEATAFLPCVGESFITNEATPHPAARLLAFLRHQAGR